MKDKRRFRPNSSVKGNKGAPPWMVTYSDMVTLILVFFIMLFSMSQIDNIKFQRVIQSFRESVMDFYPSMIEMPYPEGSIEMPEDEGLGIGGVGGDGDLEKMVEEIQQYLDEHGLEDVILANRTERGVVLVLDEQVLFETGEAEITGGQNDFLDKVGSMLQSIPNMVKVEGHTDNRPITTFRYPSNWELSTARASSVIRYLVDHFQLDPDRFIAVGYGETRPIVPNDSPENWEKNRRVEIVISDPKYSEDDIIDR